MNSRNQTAGDAHLGRRLNLLLVEDSEDDAALVLLELRRGGYDVFAERVDNEADMRAALDRRPWDVVVADHVMPRFSAPAAIETLRASCRDVPLIVVSGHIGEDMAVAAMKAGASDFVMKDRLGRLLPAIERELREAEVHRARKAAADALRDSEERLKLALEAGRMGAWQRNLVTGEASWSEITEQIYGLKPGTFRGDFEQFMALVHPEDRPFVRGEVRRAIAEHTPYNVEFRVVRPNGEIVWVESRGRLLMSSGGQPEHFAGVTVDITARKRIEASQRFLVEFSDRIRPLADPADLLRVALTAIGGHLKVSRALAAELPRGSGEVLICPNYLREGNSLEGIYPVESLECPALLELVRGQGVAVNDTHADHRTAGPDGAFFEQHGIRAFIAMPYIEDGELMWVVAVTSSRPRVWTPHEIGLLVTVTERTWIAQKSARLFAAAQHARDEAEAAARAKDRFLAVLSHELRTPLTPVLMSIYALQSEPSLSPRASAMLAMMERNIRLESRLIEDLLDLSRITHNKVELQLDDVDLHEVIGNAVEVCRADIAGKSLDLHVDLSATVCHVRGDSARLQQVFWNLLKNAAKFTPAGGRLTIRSSNATNHVRVEVEDTGIGIEPQFLPKVFTAFEQGGGSAFSAQFGGLGLGLAISKATVDAHGGKISAASAGADTGAVFTVDLPLVPEEHYAL
jgi:PAS domain S-box-containing protein